MEPYDGVGGTHKRLVLSSTCNSLNPSPRPVVETFPRGVQVEQAGCLSCFTSLETPFHEPLGLDCWHPGSSLPSSPGFLVLLSWVGSCSVTPAIVASTTELVGHTLLWPSCEWGAWEIVFFFFFLKSWISANFFFLLFSSVDILAGYLVTSWKLFHPES